MNVQNNVNNDIELSRISVLSESEIRCVYWKYDVNNDFLIICVNISDGELELIVDSPQK